MKKHITMVTATAMILLAAISFNSIAAYAQGGANMTGMMPQTSPENQIIHVVPEHESAEQIRNEIRSNHPLLAAVADQIETMDARETLRYMLGVEIVTDLLKMHSLDLIINQTAGSQSIIP
jgi:hypothetical protein